MKRIFGLHFLLLAISACSGYLMSQMSMIGRIGIDMMHKELKFLQIWWQGAIVVYAVLLLLYLVQSLLHKILPLWVARFIHFVLLGVAVWGLYYTYNDFSDDISHRWMRQRFHVGAYLFWFGWMVICVYFTFMPAALAKGRGKTAPSAPWTGQCPGYRLFLW